MAINLAAISSELLPGLLAVEGKYKEVPLELESIFTKKKSFMNQEFVSHMRYTGISQQKFDGESVAYDNEPREVYKNNLKPIGAGLGYVFTRNALADNLYKSDFGVANMGLANGMRAFWNQQSAFLFNNCTVLDPTVGGDGQPLASTAHPIGGGAGGTFATTTSTPQSLTEGALLSALKTIPTTYVDEAGLYIDVEVQKIVIPWNLKDVALRLTQSILRPGSAENDPNIIHEILGPVNPMVVSRYLTNQFGWFLTTNVKGWIELDREEFETDMFVDFDTDNLKVKCYERKGYFNTDPRSGYFQFATA